MNRLSRCWSGVATIMAEMKPGPGQKLLIYTPPPPATLEDVRVRMLECFERHKAAGTWPSTYARLRQWLDDNGVPNAKGLDDDGRARFRMELLK